MAVVRNWTLYQQRATNYTPEVVSRPLPEGGNEDPGEGEMLAAFVIRTQTNHDHVLRLTRAEVREINEQTGAMLNE